MPPNIDRSSKPARTIDNSHQKRTRNLISESQTTMTNNHDVNDSNNGDGYFFLSKQARRNIPNYQYKGEDRSMFFKYVLSPLAAFCVDNLTPSTTSPNTITLIGLVLMIIAYLIFWFYIPSLEIDPENEPPRWIFLYNCIAMLVYQTLDNMDGKQARKTESSSPMGLLFDHGCDAINSIFGSANWIISMGIQPLHEPTDLILCAVIIFGPFASFYIATWEEYHTGELILPIVNGPSEGLFGGAMLSLTSFILGPFFWQQTSWLEAIVTYLPEGLATSFAELNLRNCDIMVGMCGLAFIQEMVLRSASVAHGYGLKALEGVIPIAIFLTCSFAIGIVTPEVWLEQPRMSMHLLAALFTEMCTQLMLSHIAQEPFNPWRWQLLPLVFLACYSCYFGSDASEEMGSWVVIYSSAMVMFVAMKTTIVLHELCRVLNIYCFVIDRRPQKVDSKLL